MRRSPRVVTSIVLLLAQLTTACGSWRVPPVSPQDFMAHEHPNRIRVREQGGGTHVLSDPHLAGDTLTGLEKGQERRIPMATVDEVAVRRFNVLKTVGLIVLIPAVVIGTVAIIMCSGDTGRGCVGT
jgi:hypothetical protein